MPLTKKSGWRHTKGAEVGIIYQADRPPPPTPLTTTAADWRISSRFLSFI